IEEDIRFRYIVRENLKTILEEPIEEFKFTVQEVKDFYYFYKQIPELEIKDFDIFFVDIELKSFYNGIQIASEIRAHNENCQIIFLTGLKEKAVEVINESIYPSAYLVKSLDEENIYFQLYDVMNMVKKQFIQQINSKEHFFYLKAGEQSLLLSYQDILYFSSIKTSRNSLLIKTVGKEYTIKGTLKEIKEQLTSPPFLLNLRSYIINLENIEKISTIDELIFLKNGESLSLSSKILRKIER